MTRKVLQLILGTAILAAANVIASAAQVRVELLDSATVEGEFVYLRDLARVTGDPEQVAKMGSIGLGYSPSIGSVREISIERIRLVIETRRSDVQAVEFMGAKSVRILRASQEILAEELREAIRNEVRRNVSSPNFVRIDVPEKIAIPMGTLRVNVSLSSSTNLFRPFMVSILVEVNGRVFRRLSATVAIEAEAEIYVAAKDLAAGERLSSDSIRLERRRLGDSKGRYLTPGVALKGIVLVKPILAGRELTSDAFMSGVVIRSGDMVKIIAKSGAVQLSISGQARSSGKVGERITVKNLQSDAVIQATVVDEGIVEVRF